MNEPSRGPSHLILIALFGLLVAQIGCDDTQTDDAGKIEIVVENLSSESLVFDFEARDSVPEEAVTISSDALEVVAEDWAIGGGLHPADLFLSYRLSRQSDDATVLSHTFSSRGEDSPHFVSQEGCSWKLCRYAVTVTDSDMP